MRLSGEPMAKTGKLFDKRHDLKLKRRRWWQREHRKCRGGAEGVSFFTFLVVGREDDM